MERVVKEDMPPLIITIAITGGAHGKEANPNLPETPQEQAEETYKAYQAGAASVHIHARDKSGANGIADPVRFREINRRIRERCPDIIIGNSTGVGIDVPRSEVVNVLDADPELCSLNTGPIPVKFRLTKREEPLTGRPNDIDSDTVMPITFAEQESIAKKALAKGIKPELEVYNVSMFTGVQNLIRKHLIEKPYWMQLIFGFNFEVPSLSCFLAMLNCLPPQSMFSVIGVGPFQLPLATLSILVGGHVRVGFEDNIYYRKGELAMSNAQLVERIVRIASELGRKIATPSQAREILSISKNPRSY